MLYAAPYTHAVCAINVAAPHIFVEDITLRNIEHARQTYLHTDLARKLGRYHSDLDSGFWSWNNAWLVPDFRHWNIQSVLATLHFPIIAIQGLDDHYGSLEQIRGIKRHAPQTQLVELADCGHSPHIDQPELLIQLIAEIGGFGGAGMPNELIHALIDQSAPDLTVVSNNETGLAALIKAGRVRRMICSFPKASHSWVFDELYKRGKIELECVPQGTIAERLRAAGAGLGGISPEVIVTPGVFVQRVAIVANSQFSS